MAELLVICDMQEGFRSNESELLIPHLQSLADHFKDNAVYATFKNEKGSPFETQLGWTKFQDENDQKMMHEFDARKEFVHTGYTVFTDALLKHIEENNIETVYLCGIYTDVTIIKSAMDAFEKGINVKVIVEACNSLHGENNHTYAIDSLKHIIGKQHVVWLVDIIQ